MHWEKTAAGLRGLAEKLDAACQKLWDEDRASAAALQAVADELKLALAPAAEQLAALGAAAAAGEVSGAHQRARIKDLEEDLKAAEGGLAAAREEIKLAKAHVARVSDELVRRQDAEVDLNANLRRLEHELTVARAETAARLEELALLKGAAERTQSGRSLALDENLELKAAAKHLEKELAAARADGAAQLAELKDLRAAAAALREEQGAARNEAADLRAAAARLGHDLAAARAAAEELQRELLSQKAHTETAQKQAAEMEEALQKERERFLHLEAQKDAERVRRMSELIAELEEKEAALEDSWSKRHRALEAEQKEYQADLERRHDALNAELKARAEDLERLYREKEARLLELNDKLIQEFQAREAAVRSQEEELRAQHSLLASRSAEIGRDYDRKRAELEGYKQKVEAEVAALLKQGGAD